MEHANASNHPQPWNKGKLIGQKAPFKLKGVWAIRVRLQMHGRTRELALFDLGIDSKLRACDFVKLRVRDVCYGDHVAARAIVLQQKTQHQCSSRSRRPPARRVTAWIKQAGLKLEDYLFPSRIHGSPHLGTRHTGAPRACGLSSSCWATPGLKGDST
jgi:hypothetical protein